MHPVNALAAAVDTALRGGDLDGAEELVSAGIRDHPDDVPLWIRLGKVNLRRPRYAEALAALRHASTLMPDDPEVLQQLAHGLRLDHRAAEALNVTVRLIEQLGVDSPAALHVHAQALTDTGQPESALPILVDLTQRFETSGAYWISLARALVRAGRFREADAVAQRVVQDVPDHVPGYVVIAAANHALHRHDAWIAAANKVVELGPHLPAALLWQARIARHTEAHDEEMDYLARALAVQPRLIEARVQLAEAYWRTGDLDRAHRHFTEAFAQGFPIDGLAVGAMAEFHAATGRGAILLDELEQDALQRPGSGLCAHLGVAFTTLRQYQRAVRLLHAARAQCPEAVDTMLHLAVAYRALGRLPDAEYWARRARQLTDGSASDVGDDATRHRAPH